LASSGVEIKSVVLLESRALDVRLDGFLTLLWELLRSDRL
jgi:hypothetical protein